MPDIFKIVEAIVAGLFSALAITYVVTLLWTILAFLGNPILWATWNILTLPFKYYVEYGLLNPWTIYVFAGVYILAFVVTVLGD